MFFSLGFPAVILSSGTVHAALGETVKSVETDRRVLSARSAGETITDRYTIHEIRYDSTTVREYASPSGIVFGIAWNGFVHPDLDKLLGTYFSQYEEARRRTPRTYGRARSEVKAKGVVVQKWGHMRNLQGRAYAPELLPPGVSIDEIK